MTTPSASAVRARATAFVDFQGREVRIELGADYAGDDPLVTAFPTLFAPPAPLGSPAPERESAEPISRARRARPASSK